MNINYQLNISVIIPVYNDPLGLEVTLKSLAKQKYPKEDYEVIVCDNGSTDDTLDITKDYTFKNPNIKIVVENMMQSSYAARNKGIMAAKGSIIAFIDSNMIVDENYINGIVDIFKKNEDVSYIGCKVEIYFNKNNIIEKYDKLTGFPIEKNLKSNNFTPTCCLAVKSDIFKKVGLFNPRLISGGDFEFGNRVFKNKYKLYYFPHIILMHPARNSLKSFVKKYFRIGRGIRQLYYYYPQYIKKSGLNFFNLSSYLPLSGKKTKKDTVRKFSSFSNSEKGCLYLMDYIKKIAKFLGYFYQSCIWLMRK